MFEEEESFIKMNQIYQIPFYQNNLPKNKQYIFKIIWITFFYFKNI